ncbi:MAG: sugar phosphate isomerase/epimerase family protein [Planctomycetota bacterium]|jgi:sugar phosphate isomerase/epimerase
MNRHIRIIVAFLVVSACLFLSACAAPHSTKGGLTNPFFAMDTGTDRKNLSAAEQAQMLKDLGFAGIGYSGIDGIQEMLGELEKRNLKMFNTYLGISIDPDSRKYDPRLKDAIAQLKGKDVLLWLNVTSRQFESSSQQGDPHAVDVIREVADMAEQSDLKVALYPHTSSWVETVEDAVRMAKKVNRKNVGATFNLCHWLKVEGSQNMKPLMQAAMPHLFVVTINGADSGNTKEMLWNRLIQPLDTGSFDTYQFVRTLKQLGYNGPIGLQHYGIKGDARENLKRSMNAWRQFSERMNAEKELEEPRYDRYKRPPRPVRRPRGGYFAQ